jgi:hypothetical protein
VESIGNEPYYAIGTEKPGDSVFSGYFESDTLDMNTHEGNPHPHGGEEAEKHKEMQAEMANADMRNVIADITRSADAGEIGKAQLLHSMALTALATHQERGELSQEEIDTFDAELHRLFGRIELDEAA